jgi:predicted PurR-regulated permease PerM
MPSSGTSGTSVNSRSVGLTTLAVVAAGGALYLAQEVFIPLALGLLFTALFRPVVRGLGRVRVPEPAGATLVVVLCLALLGGAGYFAAGPVQNWIRDAPKTLSAARGKIDQLRRPIKQVSEAVEEAQKQVTGGGEQAQKGQEAAAAASSSPVPTFLGRVFTTTTGILGTLLQMVVVAFLVLATGDLFARKLALVMPKPVQGTPEQAVDAAESVVRRYLVVTILLAGGQGVVIALIFMLLGMPSPILWGVLTLVLESIPYIGALFMVAAVSVTAFATFDSLGQVLFPPLAYVVISTIQNNVISPFAYGTGLRLNPLAVLVVVLVGWFLWGVAGAFVAVPLLAAVKTFAERLSRDSRLAAVLAE